MSHHNLPRIHFRGTFQANVPTANNDDIAIAFPDQQFVDVAQVRLNTFGMDDAAFATWLRQVAAPFGIRAGWNLFGTGYCSVPESTVQSVHTSAGGLTRNPSVDPFIGARVSFPGGAVMADLDPEGTLATQIFCDEFRLSLGSEMQIRCRPLKFCSRDIGRRNLQAAGFSGFAANWFAAVPPDRLSILPGASGALNALHAAHQLGKGVFLAFCTYLLRPHIGQPQLAAHFANGLSTQNPAVGRWIGTLGVWDSTELKTAVAGRKLLPRATLHHDHLPFQLNPAFATVHRERNEITVDLLNTFPEVDETLQKVQVGTVRLGVVTNQATAEQLWDLGEISYDRSAYELQSGLIDLIYPPDKQTAIDEGALVLYQPDTGAKLLSETRWTVASDDRCVYLQAGEVRNLSLSVYDKGGLAMTPTVVRLAQYEQTNRVFTPASTASAVVAHDATLAVSPGGVSAFTIEAKRPGVCVLAFLPPDEDDQSVSYFVNIRVLPADNYDAIPDSSLTFAFVYDEVLRYYHLLYPAMSEKFPLNNSLRVRLKAAEIKRRISPALWDGVAYMPVTRDLSAGKRRLLERWCDLAIGTGESTRSHLSVSHVVDSAGSVPRTMQIGVFVFNGVERLDFEGPLGVLAWAAKLAAVTIHIRFVSQDGKPVRDHLLGGSIPVDGASNSADGFDLLLVPGGDLAKFGSDFKLAAELRRLGSASGFVVSVCTGAFLVAEAELATGKKMATHWRFHDEFRRRFPQCFLIDDVRFVTDGTLWSSAGISAGIDMAFAMVRSLFGDSVAIGVQQSLEYRPEPPFPWQGP